MRVLKRLILLATVVAAFLGGLVSGLYLALPSRSFAEVLQEGLGPHLDGVTQTQFAPSLQEETFRSLPLGSTAAQVVTALGRPLGQRDCYDGATCWDYSSPMNSDTGYLRRTLVLDRSGHMVERYMGYVLGD
jgi:outer membrane protein assembly factor BamE (lipoprotein component of BamABCDE complex)